jgi:hypothetical protein
MPGVMQRRKASRRKGHTSPSAGPMMHPNKSPGRLILPGEGSINYLVCPCMYVQGIHVLGYPRRQAGTSTARRGHVVVTPWSVGRYIVQVVPRMW